MDMNTIKMGLLVIMLVCTLISAVVYSMRRSDNKNALDKLTREGQPLRRLTVDERALVQPFLFFGAATRQQPAELAHDNVVALEGAFVRHGIESNGGASTMHDTLGGVEVVLPYDARDYLIEHNRAEVVVTGKFAIVVSLNGEFDLAGGHERDQKRKARDQQWASGKAGAVQDVIEPPLPPSEPDPGQDDLAQAMRVEILGQRDETPAEVADRERPGIALWIAVVWFLVYAGLGVTAAGGGVAFAGAAAALAVLALWLTWRKRRPGVPQKVNRAQGVLHAVVLTNADNTQAVAAKLFLGDKVPVTLPERWRAHLALPEDGRVDLDMRTEDYSVVRLDGTYSVDEEMRRFPQVWWGRHLTLALTGACAGAVLLLSADRLGGDAALASAWLRGVQPLAYDSAEALARDVPAFGDVVAVHGNARCELRPDAYSDTVVVDCARLRWGGAAPLAGELDVREPVMSMYTGDFLKTRPNPVADMLLNSRILEQMRTNPRAFHGLGTVSAQTVREVSKTVLLIDEACASARGESIAKCDKLKREFASNLFLEAGEPGAWPDLLKLAQNGILRAKARGDEGTMLSRDVERARASARSSMHGAVEAAITRASMDAMDTQRGGVVLHVLRDADAVLPALEPAYRIGLMEVWEQRLRVLSGEGAMPFKINGMVVGVDADDSGAPRLVVDAGLRLDDPWPSLARMAWLLLAGLLVLVHAPLAMVRWRAAAARGRALDEYVRSRAAKPVFF